ncbi:hypothetical protein FN846DRAFT_888492 [Sphaerosporella brunnea]|uniref:Uncharacterized protein n=1 Tax=Sphaerosporella brunnea TaxID=1250544 RepID=A0A5J5F307_9PEZI|nr:hypothetical protein FN846DRAFT_888492 [Sphaerosporella brunnea]
MSAIQHHRPHYTPVSMPAEMTSNRIAAKSETPIPQDCQFHHIYQQDRSRSETPTLPIPSRISRQSETPIPQLWDVPGVPAIDELNGNPDGHQLSMIDYSSDPEVQLDLSEHDADGPSDSEMEEVHPLYAANACSSSNNLDESDVDGDQGDRPIEAVFTYGSSDVEDLNDLDNSNFNYRRVQLQPLTPQEQISFAYQDITITHHISRAAIKEFCTLQPEHPLDPRTTAKHIARLTGIKEVRYDCCVKGCVSYSLPQYSALRECPIDTCRHPRYRTING